MRTCIAVIGILVGTWIGGCRKKAPEGGPSVEFDAACQLFGTGELLGKPHLGAEASSPVKYFLDRICQSEVCRENHFFDGTRRLESYRLEERYAKFQNMVRKFLKCGAVERVISRRRFLTLVGVVQCLAPMENEEVRVAEQGLSACIGHAFVDAYQHMIEEAGTVVESGKGLTIPPPALPTSESGAEVPPKRSTHTTGPDPSEVSSFRKGPFAETVVGEVSSRRTGLEVLSAEDLNPEVICAFTAADFKSESTSPETIALIDAECRRMLGVIQELVSPGADRCWVAMSLIKQEALPIDELQLQDVLSLVTIECASLGFSGKKPPSPPVEEEDPQSEEDPEQSAPEDGVKPAL